MKTLIADYGVGNIHSIEKAMQIAGADVKVVSDLSLLSGADCAVLPGVGAFDAVMSKFDQKTVRELLSKFEEGLPALTVCIGTHVLLEKSDEGKIPGMHYYDGEVCLLKSKTVPHMGWNNVISKDQIMEGISDSRFYFAHSYYCDAKDSCVIGRTEYDGFEFPTMLKKHNVISTQFHPEKSSDSGIKFLKNFVKFAEDQQ